MMRLRFPRTWLGPAMVDVLSNAHENFTKLILGEGISMHQQPAPSRAHRMIVSLFSCAVVLGQVLASNAAQADTDITISLPGFLNFKMVDSDFDTPTGRVKIKIHGDAVFTDAEDDVLSLTDKIVIQEQRKDHTLRIAYQAERGSVKSVYTVDGREQALDADGKRWLATVIPVILRESAINVEKRIKRIYAKGGADAVLAEIELIHSDYARRSYIVRLPELGRLDDKQLARLLADTSTMNSDFERRTAYVTIIQKQTLNTANQVTLLNGAAKMNSDFEVRTVLVELAPKMGSEAGVGQAWLAAIKGMHSDFEMRTAIVALADHVANPALQIDWLLQASQNLSSDFEHRTVLVEICANMSHPTAAQVAAYAKSAQHISSDFERRTALIALVEKSTLNKDGYVEVLNAVSGMGSDFEIRTVLVAIARQMPADNDLINRYRKVARNLGDFERGQAEKALDHLI